MILNSIRWRLQIWHSLLLVVVLAGFGFTAYQVARDNQLRRIDHELNQDLMSLMRPERHGPGSSPGPGLDRGPGDPTLTPQERDLFNDPNDPRGPGRGPNRFGPKGEFRREPNQFSNRMKQAIESRAAAETGQTNTVYFVLWQTDGKVLARTAAAPAEVPAPEGLGTADPTVAPDAELGDMSLPRERSGPMQPGIGRTRGIFREVYKAFPDGAIVLAGRAMTVDLTAMRRLALGLAMAGAGVLLLGLLGGWWLATRAIRPIEAISNTAQKIAGGDLSQRIGTADTDNELGRLAAVLNSTFARLEAAFAQQARFTSDASHELRTPVSVILTQTQSALNKDRAPAEYRASLEACQRAAQRMRRLIESLLELARWDAGQEQLRRAPLKLQHVAETSLELVRPLAEERGIVIHSELTDAEVAGDADRLGQVITNLLTNAVVHNSTRGEVRLGLHKDHGAAVVTVVDQGPGIPAEELPHIFERFYRADKSRTSTTGGTGLGLAISKAIVDAHGGSIQVTSQPGAGTSVVVRLPMGSG